MSSKNTISFLKFGERKLDDQQSLPGPSEQTMLFDFDEFPPYLPTEYDYSAEINFESDAFHLPPDATAAIYGFDPTSSYDSSHIGSFAFCHEVPRLQNPYAQPWFNPHNMAASTTPSSSSGTQSSSPISFGEHLAYAGEQRHEWPSAVAAPAPLSRSISSSPYSFHEPRQQQHHTGSLCISPQDTQLWDTPSPPWHHRRLSSSPRHSPLAPDTGPRLRPLAPRRAESLSPTQLDPANLFPTFSVPTHPPVGHNTIRTYSRRAHSFSALDDRDATVRGRKRAASASTPEDGEPLEKARESPPLKSMLRPPKLAPSAWQLYFTDWIQRQQESSSRKLSVAQAAKEAGQEYAGLTEKDKEPYKRRSQAAKDVRERELAAYMRTLTPEDIKRENMFRSAQRKAGKSRKSNMKDPNAPKKPLSAYFMFLQRIRANPELVREIFGEEMETTRQSVLAAAKWRAMTDEERRPFLIQAEQEKIEYEAARRMYQDGSVGYGSSINFSILPGSPAFPIKVESDNES